MIFISTPAIHRDPAYFNNPDAITLNDTPAHHVSYGYGSHFCLVAKLARIEMISIFKALLTRYPGLALHPDYTPQRKHHSLSFSGFEQLVLQA